MFPKQPSDYEVAPKGSNNRQATVAPFGLGVLFIVAVNPTLGLAEDCSRVTALETFATTATVPDGSTCTTYSGLTGSSGVSCYWEFPFRSSDAVLFSKGLWAEVARCRDGHQAPGTNPVNHPDSYNVRELNTDLGTYRVTIKDKNQTQRTLVFLSLEQNS